ncbi:MAG: biotin/lipoyl-binding protein [Candidatus Eremiobacteraeota bacterium]|nr:biotin/lipoyl-binding protein [Candidatus Eremiobacteraeota bacterium]
MYQYQFVINGNDYNVHLEKITEEEAVVDVNGTEYTVNIEQLFKQKTPKLVRKSVVHESISRPRVTKAPGKEHGFKTIKAPLPGVILEVNVKEGDLIKVGQFVLKMEAMKMENDIQTPTDGKVLEVYIKPGDSVLEGAQLLKIGQEA